MYRQQQTKQKGQNFIICSSHGHPNDLVLLQQPSLIIQQMFESNKPSYFWYTDTKNKQILQKMAESIQVQSNIKIKCFQDENTLRELIMQIQNLNKQKYIIMNYGIFMKIAQNIRVLPEDKMIVFINEMQSLQAQFYKFIKVYDETNLISVLHFIQQNTKIFRQLPNFVSIQSQLNLSNMITKTIYAMICQNISLAGRKNIINQLKRLLTQIISTESYFYSFQQTISTFLNQLSQGPLDKHRAIFWYTSQTPIFKFINNMLRLSKHPTQIFYIQPFFFDLYSAVFNLYKQQQGKNQYQDFVCFRGGTMSQQQIKSLRVDNIIQNLGFLSTSLNKNAAMQYTSNVFFEIEVKRNLKYSQFCFAWIAESSKYFVEQQVLFNPLNSFKIVSIENSTINQKNVICIKISFGQFQKILLSIQKPMKTIQQMRLSQLCYYKALVKKNSINQGVILIDFEHNEKGSDVFISKYLDACVKNSHQYIFGLTIKSRFQANNNNFKQSLRILEQCLNLIQQSQQLRSKIQLIGKICIQIAVYYLKMSQYEKFFQFYQKKRKIIQRLQLQVQFEIDTYQIINQIAKMYIKHNNCTMALKIYESINFKIKRRKITNILLSQAICYTNIKKYDQAIKICQQIQTIQCKIQGKQYIDVYVFLCKARIHRQTKQYHKCLNQLQKCSELTKNKQNQYAKLSMYFEFGCYHKQLKQYRSSQNYFLKIIKQNNQLRLQQNYLFAESLEHLKQIYIYKQSQKYAIKQLQQISYLIAKKQNKNDIKFIQTQICVGYFYSRLNCHHQALQILLKCKLLIKNHFLQLNIKQCRNIIFLIVAQSIQTRKYDIGFQCLQEYKKFLRSSNNYDVCEQIYVLQSMSAMQIKMGNNQKAIYILKNALILSQKWSKQNYHNNQKMESVTMLQGCITQNFSKAYFYQGHYLQSFTNSLRSLNYFILSFKSTSYNSTDCYNRMCILILRIQQCLCLFESYELVIKYLECWRNYQIHIQFKKHQQFFVQVKRNVQELLKNKKKKKCKIQQKSYIDFL